MSNYTKAALSGAKKICGAGDCIAPFHCGHANKSKHAIHFCFDLDENTPCPLEQYNVRPKRTKDAFDASQVTDNEIVSLCVECQYGSLDRLSGGDLYLNRESNFAMCINCPVFMTEEAIEENRAEARWC